MHKCIFPYMSYCDMIRMQMLDWSQSCGLAKLWNWPKNRWFHAVRFIEGIKPIATVPAWFQPGPGTNLRIWNRCLHYMQRIAHRRCLDPSSSKYRQQQANSIIKMVD